MQLGNVKLSFMPGLQYTIRRDTLAPAPMNQNLFRQFLYVASSPIGNWLSFSGNVIREAGPFTEQDLHSRDFSGALDFRVGRPWGKTALLTGYNARDLLFGPSVHEYYQTISYAGLERKFGSRIRASAVAEFLRAWRVEGNHFAIAQTLRPRFGLDAELNRALDPLRLGCVVFRTRFSCVRQRDVEFLLLLHARTGLWQARGLGNGVGNLSIGNFFWV